MEKRLWVFKTLGSGVLCLLTWLNVSYATLSPSGVNYEVVALMAIKDDLKDPRNVMDNWDLSSVDPCSWRMVTCTPDGSVSALGLPSQNLSGTLSPAIGNLSNLQSFTLQNNAIFGPITAAIGKLQKLQTLDLSGNIFSGQLPSSLGDLKNLIFLRLNNNSLTGTVPESLSEVGGLTLVDVSYNNLSGSLPKLSARTFRIIGNPLLCGQNSANNCSDTYPEPLSFTDWNAKSQIIQLICENHEDNNRTRFISNFFKAMTDIYTKLQTSHTGTLVTGTGSSTTYVLAHCYADLSSTECILCGAQARISLPNCLPNNGGRVYLEGCFMRFQNYSFFGEHTGQKDRIKCLNTTTKNNEFEQSASNAVFQAVETAPRSPNHHAGTQALISGIANRSAYATADCWSSLDAESCGQCLQTAARPMLGCLPGSRGYALYTGCFMRYSDTNFSNPDDNTRWSTGGSKRKLMAIVMVVSSVVVFVVVGIIAFCAKKHRSKSKRRQGSDDTKLLKILNSSSLNFKYSMIEKATSSFDEANKLGQGGFGTVYKGVLPNGREIAAKRLFSNHQHRAGDFFNEVNIISSVEHKNLVKLVGFSCLGPESVLIYEYLPNKSLDHFIFDAVRGKELNWGKRFNIIVGTAQGLVHLHENSKTRIIHRDIKAANILLDSKLHAKIADFGLARSFQQDKNHISTGIAGTLGYMAPEYIAHGQLTEKVDVYSYGVLLLEVVTGMPNRGTQTAEHTHNLVSIVWKHFKEGTVEEVFDPNMMLSDDNVKKEVEKVVHIGLLCTQEVPSLRPAMSMALQMLSKNIHPLPLPSNPAFLPKSNVQPNEFGSDQAFRHGITNPTSVPTDSLTSLGPR